jgi:ferredoxin
MRAVVVGSGAGGATTAYELTKNGIEVVLLEAGKPFKPFTRKVGWADSLRRAGLLGGERLFTKLFRHMDTQRTEDDILLVRGVTLGGCTTLSCGCMARAEKGLREIGLDLTPEFDELESTMNINTIPRDRWSPVTGAMFDSAKDMGLDPILTPKAIDLGKCVACGLCEIGCASGAKWDSRQFLGDIESSGGRIITDMPVKRVVIENGRAVGVEAGKGRSLSIVKGDVIVLAAGGIGTAQILEASDIPTEDNLWVDYVLTLGGVMENANQIREQPMTWYIQRNRYILSPYMDLLSHFYYRLWRPVPISDRVGLMMKFADTPGGKVLADGTVLKEVIEEDKLLMESGIEESREIMEKAGVSGPFVEGLLNAGHLGGTVPLRKDDIDSMRPGYLPEGLWISDLSLVPSSQGFPTMLTTAAISLKVSRKIMAETLAR